MDESPKKNMRGRRRLIRIVCSFLSLAALTYIAVTIISGRTLTFFGIFGNPNDGGLIDLADEFHFNVGRSRVFADMDGSLAAVGTLGIQVLDAGGTETLRDSFRITTPAIYANEGQAVAFDVGGNSVRVFDKTGVKASIETDGPVVSAVINRNGWFAVCTQEAAVSKGLVTVYNNTGRAVYRVNFVTGYVLFAALSPDNSSVAILNLTDEGSRISFYNLNSEDLDRVFELPGGLIIDARHMQSGEMLAISMSSAFLVDRNNQKNEIYAFGGSYLGGYALDGDFIALYLLDYNVGHSGRLITFDERGRLLGEIETDREIISMSAVSGYLAVLRSDGLIFYDRELEELPVSGEAVSTAGAVWVVAIGKGVALVAGDNSAVTFRTEN